jgi:hypothetical protein
MIKFLFRCVVLGLAGFGAKTLYERSSVRPAALRGPGEEFSQRVGGIVDEAADRAGHAAREAKGAALDAVSETRRAAADAVAEVKREADAAASTGQDGPRSR